MEDTTQNIRCKQKIGRTSNTPQSQKLQMMGDMANVNKIIPWSLN